MFEECFSKDFSNYQKTPIFHEINDDILRICVAENIFMNNYPIIFMCVRQFHGLYKA